VSVPEDLLRVQAGLAEPVVTHLQRLLGDWQILADLSFADLLLWVPVDVGDRHSYLCVGQMRPYTAQTIYVDDFVGELFDATDRPMVGRALSEGRVIRDADPDWSMGVPVREEAIPVRYGDDIVAVVTREANVSTARSPSQLELTYLQAAGHLAQMLSDGTFPYRNGEDEEREHSPRVGDGVARLDAQTEVAYASPNAISAYRRLGSVGSVIGERLEVFDPEPQALLHGLQRRRPVYDEIENDGAIVLRRLIPLIADGEVLGALLLVRDVTELRRHERALRVKDATIREIHHRVKNNLQTVASLLRLQTRRLKSEEARAALTESVRRITSIALVHETLSHESREQVPFKEIAERIMRMLHDGLANPEIPADFITAGDPGDLPAEVATPLALVLTELVQNSAEHAFVGPDGLPPSGTGTVRIDFERGPMTLRVLVSDDGCGLPEGTGLDEVAGLGLQIVRTLVESELGGFLDTLEVERGTAVELLLPLP
jgi:two-component system, sensor histidine kinase PdtaS